MGVHAAVNDRELTDEELLHIARLMKQRRDYSLKAISRRFQVSVKTLYRIEQRVTRFMSPPIERKPE